MSPEAMRLGDKLFIKCALSGDFHTSNCERIEDEITLAAYAKAEMAKRGWMFSVVEKHVRMWGILGTPHESEITELYEFNPTDPLSEARAIIEACIEALELEQ